MNNLLKTTKIELFKTAKLPLFWYVFVLPLCLTVFVIYTSHSQIAGGFWTGSNFWRLYFNGFFVLYSFILPVIQAVVASSLLGLEYKNNAFQMLYTLPSKRRNILISKVLMLTVWTFIFLLFVFALILFSGTVLLQFYPDESAFDFSVCMPVIQFFSKIFIACIVVGVIHLMISFCNISQSISVLSASFMTIICVFSANWQYSYILPYVWTFSFTRDFSTYEVNNLFVKEVYFALFYIIIFILAGTIINQKKKRLSL